MTDPALHCYDGGLWIASCPSCGCEVAASRSQARCERRAASRPCPNGCALEDADDLDLLEALIGPEPIWLVDAADAAASLEAGALDDDERERLRRLGSLP